MLPKILVKRETDLVMDLTEIYGIELSSEIKEYADEPIFDGKIVGYNIKAVRIVS